MNTEFAPESEVRDEPEGTDVSQVDTEVSDESAGVMAEDPEATVDGDYEDDNLPGSDTVPEPGHIDSLPRGKMPEAEPTIGNHVLPNLFRPGDSVVAQQVFYGRLGPGEIDHLDRTVMGPYRPYGQAEPLRGVVVAPAEALTNSDTFILKTPPAEGSEGPGTEHTLPAGLFAVDVLEDGQRVYQLASRYDFFRPQEPDAQP